MKSAKSYKRKQKSNKLIYKRLSGTIIIIVTLLGLIFCGGSIGRFVIIFSVGMLILGLLLIATFRMERKKERHTARIKQKYGNKQEEVKYNKSYVNTSKQTTKNNHKAIYRSNKIFNWKLDSKTSAAKLNKVKQKNSKTPINKHEDPKNSFINNCGEVTGKYSKAEIKRDLQNRIDVLKRYTYMEKKAEDIDANYLAEQNSQLQSNMEAEMAICMSCEEEVIVDIANSDYFGFSKNTEKNLDSTTQNFSSPIKNFRSEKIVTEDCVLENLVAESDIISEEDMIAEVGIIAEVDMLAGEDIIAEEDMIAEEGVIAEVDIAVEEDIIVEEDITFEEYIVDEEDLTEGENIITLDDLIMMEDTIVEEDTDIQNNISCKDLEGNAPYSYPSSDLLQLNETVEITDSTNDEADRNAKKLIDTLESFGVRAKVVNISRGPSVTRYEIQPDYGVKVSKIVGLTDDIALNLAATGVRMEAPIPGKAAVGIEIPNKEVKPVLLRDVVETEEFNNHSSKVAFAVGKDIAGNVIIADISKMPHLLIAGATGSGKSVCINTLIASILFKASPLEVKLLMIDPKVVELGIYNGIPHLLIPVVTDPKKAAGALNWAVQEMLSRYKLFADNNARDLKGFNLLQKDKPEGVILPQIVIIIDELADLMMAAPDDVEDSICRLAQMARAAGMHLVIATQRPSVDVITGVIKANIPSRISFAVSSQIDSRTILDMAGAEKLVGRGDMLFNPMGRPKPLRVQGALVTDKEVEAIVNYVKSIATPQYDEDVIEKINSNSDISKTEVQDEDDLLPQVISMVVEQEQASTSFIQRKFKLGYSRAARILDQLEERGIVGPFEGSKPRKVLISKQEWFESNSTI